MSPLKESKALDIDAKNPMFPQEHDIDSDEEYYKKNKVVVPLKKTGMLGQFTYSLPMIHEFLSIICTYDEEDSRPVRFTLYYMKTIIMMALTSVFGDSLG